MNGTSFNWRQRCGRTRGNHKRDNDAWSDVASCTGEGLKNGEQLILFEPIKGFAT
jgi:hypothetical protein